MRKIPVTMATQHPDNANAPYWERDGDGFVSTQEEVTECYSAFQDLGCQEFMWDWEGKHVDEAVVDKLFHAHYDYFKKVQLGRDRFLTFRIPNIWHERGYSLGRAFMGMLTAERFARDLKMNTPPLFEVILPMVDKADHIIHIQKTFSQLAAFTQKLFHEPLSLKYLNVIPLLEGIDDLTNSPKLLERYLKLHQKNYHHKPDYLRLHIARSDPALNAGLIPAVVAGKLAISDYYSFGQKHNINIYPAVGVGLLPFRGGLSPARIGDFLNEYHGIKTVYIQSAFRYDWPLAQVKLSIAKLNGELTKYKPRMLKPNDAANIKHFCRLMAPLYQHTVETIANDINEIASAVPARRERKLHVGLFGYSRQVGKKYLPRAIPFTAALYSLGVPPEFIGLGRGLQLLTKHKLSAEKYYINMRADLILAGHYLNKANLFSLAKKQKKWQVIWDDVMLTEKYLGVEFGPRTRDELAHNELSSNLLNDWRAKRKLSWIISAAGKLRHSLG